LTEASLPTGNSPLLYDNRPLQLGRTSDGAFIAGCVGAACLLPGISIASIGEIGVQPIVLLMPLYLLLVVMLGLRLTAAPLLWIMLVLVSYALSVAFSVAPSDSLLYAGFQGGYLVLGGAGFAAICATAHHRSAFVRGYMTGALVSSLVAFLQAAYSTATGNTITLANNTNFSIVGAYGRGAAFTPEPSVLAMLLIPALLCWWCERQTGSGLLAKWQRGWVGLSILVLGLLATKSSSMLYLPALIAIITTLQSKNFRTYAKSMGGILILSIAAGGVFLHFYGSRLENNDAAGSEAWRTTKVLAGISIFEDYPLTGAGLGRVSDTNFFAPYMDIPPDLRWNDEPRKGIDSTVVRTLAESGLIGFAAMYCPILFFFRRARRVFQSSAFSGIGGLSYGLLFTQTFISGYRDQLVLILPMVAFATAGNVVRIIYRDTSPARTGSDDGLIPSELNQGSI
jgi:O-antigen ligase